MAKLLGGMFRDRVQAYATGFYRVTGRGEASRLAQEAVDAARGRVRALKIKLGFGVADDLEVMRAIRDATAGRAYDAMIDTNHAYGVAEAIAARPRPGGLGWTLRWYEEPVTPEDLDGYGEVRAALATPIAGGENEHTLFGFRELFARRASTSHSRTSAPPAASPAAGTSSRSRTPTACRSTRTSGPRPWPGGIAAADRRDPARESRAVRAEPLLEFDTSSHPFREHLTDSPLRQRDGWVEIPQRPGLGIEVSRATLGQYAAA